MKKILFAEPLPFTNPVKKLGGYHYARQFSRNEWKVYYFSNPLSPFNILLTNDRKDVSQRLDTYRKGGVLSYGIWSYVPLTLVPHHNNVPLLSRRFFLDNYYRFTFPSIKSILRKNEVDGVDVLWMDYGNQFFWTQILKYEKMIYRVGDNIFAFKKKSAAIVAAHYELMEMADLILMPSQLLANKPENAKYRRKILHCPNGVDLSNFMQESYPFPTEFKHLKDKYIALYVGAIDEWFDFQLLKSVATQCKEINFVIIGPPKVRLPNDVGSNVFFLDRKDYSEIPSYIYHCDVGIIPFKDNDLVKYVSPIKMYEFFSLGKPVVSISWEELEGLNSPIYLAKSQDDFVHLVKKVCRNVEHHEREELIKYAQSNTWGARYRLVLERLGYR